MCLCQYWNMVQDSTKGLSSHVGSWQFTYQQASKTASTYFRCVHTYVHMCNLTQETFPENCSHCCKHSVAKVTSLTLALKVDQGRSIIENNVYFWGIILQIFAIGGKHLQQWGCLWFLTCFSSLWEGPSPAIISSSRREACSREKEEGRVHVIISLV